MAVAGLSIHLYLDHPVHAWFARDLRPHGFDVVIAANVGNAHASDDEHLRWATADGRAVLTYDKRDFSVLATRWAHEGRSHAGILIAIAPPLIPYGTLLRRLLVLLNSVSAEEMVDRVIWLDATWEAGHEEAD